MQPNVAHITQLDQGEQNMTIIITRLLWIV